MLPGRKFTPADIGRILIRRGWLIAITLGLGAAASVVVAKKLPDQYRSETVIMLVPQRIPDSYVKATVTAKIEDRLITLQDQILSRSRLERIILEFNLYTKLRRTLPMEDVVQRMRDDIVTKVEGKDSLSFRVSYISNDARTAQKATEKIASLFIEENTRDRENLAEDTNQFLGSQLEDARRRLIEHEKKLEEYRRQYSGELPTQAPANLSAIQNAENQLQRLAESVDRTRERRLLIETQIVDLQAEPIAVPVPPAPSGSQAPEAVAVRPVAQQLQEARATLQQLLLSRKEDHPDVKRMRRTITELTAKLEAEPQKPAPAPGPADAPVVQAREVTTPAEGARQQKLRNLRTQMGEIDRQLAEAQQQDKRLRGVIAEYQAKLEAVPRRESDLVELTRDYTTLQGAYQSLLSKREESKLAANLERRNIGEQFKVLDPARVPERPFSPNRILIDLGGTGVGLALGILLVGLLEFRNSSFDDEEDVERLCELPVLAMVPIMATTKDRRRERRRTIFVRVGALMILSAEVAIVAWGLRP